MGHNDLLGFYYRERLKKDILGEKSIIYGRKLSDDFIKYYLEKEFKKLSAYAEHIIEMTKRGYDKELIEEEISALLDLGCNPENFNKKG